MDRSKLGARRPLLGEMLVQSGALTSPQLQVAIEAQSKLRLPLGQVLVKLGHVTDETMRQVLAQQLGVPYVDLEQMVVDRSLARIVNRTYAKRHLLLPVAQLGRTLTIAMDDPTARPAVDELARVTGFTITVVTASSRSIQRAFRRLYDEEPEGLAVTTADTIAEDVSDLVLDERTSRTADELFQQILLRAIEDRCSDVHLETLAIGLHIRFRVDGVLRAPDFGASQDSLDRSAREIVSRIKILSRLDIAERRRPQDGSFRVTVDRQGTKTDIDLRVSVIPSYTGESVVVRILDRRAAPRSLDDLNLAPSMRQTLERVLGRQTGIFLVTGPTGSGKSTTLYSCLMRLHRPEIRILTAEDPVEYIYPELSQSEVDPEIGNTFANFLRSFLRHDPEVIMIGEIRDEETAEMAFRAAQTGHVLLSTLHTNSAIAALPRLLDLGVEPSLIGASLIGVMSQRLVRKLCPHCKQRKAPAAEVVAEFYGSAEPDVELFSAGGCPDCAYSGYRSRILVADFWLPDSQDQLLIMRNAPINEIQESARRTTTFMSEDAHDRVVAGLTTLDELLRVLPFMSVTEYRERYGRPAS